jgi:hypothetical protein
MPTSFKCSLLPYYNVASDCLLGRCGEAVNSGRSGICILINEQGDVFQYVFIATAESSCRSGNCSSQGTAPSVHKKFTLQFSVSNQMSPKDCLLMDMSSLSVPCR